jgi:hypothetical protein
LYDISYETGLSVLSRINQNVSIEVYASQLVNAPDSYSVEAGVFHETSVQPGIFTATLALTRDPAVNLDIKTVGDANAGVQYKYQRSSIDQSERHGIIEKLRRMF